MEPPTSSGTTSAFNTETQRREMENGAVDTIKMPAPVNTKREDFDAKPAQSVETGDSPVPSQSHTNPTPKGRSSKTSTPVLPSYETAQPRVRPTRSTNPAPKRSHKKNGSVPVVPARAPSEEEESIHEGDDEDEEGEPRYCYCNEVSFGEMVACDNDACPREWFHLSCVGMTKPPGKNGKLPFRNIDVECCILTVSSEMVLRRMQREYEAKSKREVVSRYWIQNIRFGFTVTSDVLLR